jgi:hypothetical protein
MEAKSFRCDKALSLIAILSHCLHIELAQNYVDTTYGVAPNPDDSIFWRSAADWDSSSKDQQSHIAAEFLKQTGHFSYSN